MIGKTVSDLRWWAAEDEDVHTPLWAAWERVQEAHATRLSEAIDHVKRYEGTTVIGLPGDGSSTKTGLDELDEDDDLTWNVVESCVDAAHAKLTKVKPKPYVLTDGGNFEQQTRARLLDKAIMGEFQRGGVYRTAALALRDAQVTGDGWVKVFPDMANKRVGYERLYTWEVFADDVDALKGTPRTLYHLGIVDRGVLQHRFPEHEEEIGSASSISPGTRAFRVGVDVTVEQLMVVEAWHLPSSEGAKDGRHVIAIENLLLLDEPWESDRFPVAHVQWKPRTVGLYGKGMVQILKAQQKELDRTSTSLQEAQKTLGKTFIGAERNSNVEAKQVDDEHGTIYLYDNVPLVFQSPSPIPQGTYEYEQRLYARLFETSGVSQMAATSQKPAGLESEPAFLAYRDVQTERFAWPSQEYEGLIVELAELTCDALDALQSELGSGFQTRYHGTDSWERVDYSQAQIDRAERVIIIEPASAMPETYPGKIQRVAQLMQIGAITDPQESRRLLGFPDLNGEPNLFEETTAFVKRQLDAMLLRGEPQMVDPHLLLARAKDLAQSAYLQASNRGVEDDRLQLVRDYLVSVVELMGPPPAPPAPPAPPGADIPPPGPPMPTGVPGGML